MGSRDYRHREAKKQKKDTKKILTEAILPPSPTVEVIKKRKKEPQEE